MSEWQLIENGGRLMFLCGDFENDAAMTLSGDFGDESSRDWFAQSLLAKLNTRATDAELERLRADVAGVTAERDDYRSRWEQTGCTRHHAMETAIKLHESCRQQLEAAVQERDALLKALRAVQAAAEGASGTPTDSVGERLWAIKKIARGALVAASIQQHDHDTAEGEG